MKRCTFVYKFNIYFNQGIRDRSVKLTQPKLNTEEIIWYRKVWYLYFFCAVLNQLLKHFYVFYIYLLLGLCYNEKERFPTLC